MYQYFSPFAYDPEQNNITVKVDASARTPECGSQCFKSVEGPNFFILVIVRGLLKEADAGDYPIKVTLSDDITNLKTVHRFTITLVVPPKSQRTVSSEAEVYRAGGAAGAVAPNFSSFKKSLNGANAYNVYNDTLYTGLDANLTYSTFPSASTSTSTTSSVTAVILATYADNSA